MARCDDCMKNPIHPDKKCCFNCARVGTDCEVWHNCGEDCPGWDSKGATQADKIRSMTDAELAKHLNELTDGYPGVCANLPECEADLVADRDIPLARCEGCWVRWLQEPADGR